jgi:GntR family transcriptional regulator
VPVPMTRYEIADDLTARIRAGEYPPGSQLPPYRVLAELYSVSFTTIAAVVALLRDRRVVVGVPGRGVFVPEEPAR